MDLVEAILGSWGWVGIRPVMVVGENDFGNLMIEDDQGRYWRLCPEDLSCRIVARSRAELDALSTDREFLHDWYVTALVEAARSKLGLLRPGYKYGLKVPAPLGGKYEPDNFAQLPLRELISASGDVARQIDGLPDGAKIEIQVVD